MPILTDPAEARRRLIEMLDAECDPALDTSQAAAVKASGRVTVATQPVALDTLMVGGKVYTFVTGVPGVDEIQSVASLNTTAANILAKINADTATTLCLATRNNATLTLEANTAGVVGNSIDLESSSVRITTVVFSGGAAAIEEDDISRLLDLKEVHRATVWTAQTDYGVGDIVIPATLNGHRFVCVTAGESGATEPTWGINTESRLTDGSVTWQESGLEYDLWDLRQAAYLGWSRKRGMSVTATDLSGGHSSSQIFDHCTAKMQEYLPISVA